MASRMQAAAVEPLDHDRIDCLEILKSSRTEGWSSVETRLVRVRHSSTVEVVPSHHTVSFNLRGQARIGWSYRGRQLERQAAPGRVWIVPAGEVHRFRIDGSLENLHWLIRPEQLEHVAAAVLDRSSRRVELTPLHAEPAPRLWRLALEMVAELSNPVLISRLYAESLNQALAALLVSQHSSLAPSAARPLPDLAGARLQRAIDFIDAHLDSDLSLERLASEVGLSPWHFARAFKKAVGRSPHQYVLEQRVDRAREYLRDPDASLAAVARQVGFSSSSHLITVFRRIVGVSPGAYRLALIR